MNWETEAEGVGMALTVEFPVALAMAEVTTPAREEAALATAELAASTAEEASACAEEAAEAAALVALATTLPALGMTMGTPAPLHVSSTAEMVAAWSSAVQAPWTHGCTLPRRLAPCLQWHAKSVREEQPSVVRGPTKQFKAHDGMLSSWAVATEARATMEAIWKVFMVML